MDDEETVRSLLEQVLTSKGDQVRLVEDGPKALASVAQGTPDVIVLDLYMRRIMGLGVTGAASS